MSICIYVYTICICIIYIYIKLNFTTSETCDFPVISLKSFVKVKIGKPDVWPPHRSVPLSQLLEVPPEGGVPVSCRSAACFARDHVMHHGKCEGPPTESAPPRNTRYPEKGNVWSDWGRIVDHDNHDTVFWGLAILGASFFETHPYLVHYKPPKNHPEIAKVLDSKSRNWSIRQYLGSIKTFTKK